MNTITPYRYPLDKTGLNPDNLVINEYHELANLTAKCVAPTYGNFFTRGVVIRDYVTKRQLVHKVDYMFGEIQDMVSELVAQEICAYVVIYAPNITAIEVTYQVLGGEYSYSMGSLIEMLESLKLDERPVKWPNIIGKPDEWTPESHWHKSSDIYGMEYLVHSVERVREAIMIGDSASHDEIYRYIDRSGDELSDLIQQLRNDFTSHSADKQNPHGVTKAQVGLSLVENYAIASSSEAKAGISGTKYMTPVRVAEAISEQAILPLTAHIADKQNPHGVTKAQVGLSAVQNFGIATDPEIDAGISTSKYMTPAGTRRAVEKFAGNALQSHIDNINNPHGVTKAQVGLGSVEDYGISTAVEAVNGASNAKYMTPLRVAEAITARALTNPNIIGSSTVSEWSRATTGFRFNGSATVTGLVWSGTPTVPQFDMMMGDVRLARYAAAETTYYGPNSFTSPTPMAKNNYLASLIARSNGVGDAFAAGMMFHAGGYRGKLTMNNVGTYSFGGADHNVNLFTVSANGDVLAAGDVKAFSDPRLKENMQPIEDALGVVRKLGGYSFDWKKGIACISGRAGTHDYGFDAKVARQLVPELVSEMTQGDNETYLTMSYVKVIPFLARAIDEMAKRIEDLERVN